MKKILKTAIQDGKVMQDFESGSFRIMVIGSGGREHALVHTFKRQGHKVYCLPGNAGTALICEKIPRACSIDDHQGLALLARELHIDLTVVGPEAPLANGIEAVFKQHGKMIFAPTREAAQLESSKVFSKKFMEKHQIPTARFAICSTKNEALKAAEAIFNNGVVIKPDGLTAGKGVVCCSTIEEAKRAIEEIMEAKIYGEAGDHVVIEEMLFGQEISLLVFCDGKQMIPMLPSQDHKRLLDGDRGPNTGGIGAYTPLPFVTDEIMGTINETILLRTNQGLKTDKISYKGVLYFGIILTKDGPKVLEYNCRFGDPEAQAILPLLESDLAEIMIACCQGSLAHVSIEWKPYTACTVVMVSRGYPNHYETGHTIKGLDEVNNKQDSVCFHAGTKVSGNQVVTSGGRVLAITGFGNDLQEAIKKAYEGVAKISFEGAAFRKDIAKRVVSIEK